MEWNLELTIEGLFIKIIEYLKIEKMCLRDEIIMILIALIVKSFILIQAADVCYFLKLLYFLSECHKHLWSKTRKT